MTLYPALNIIFGNVEPEAHSTSILKLNSIAVNTKSDPCIITGIRLLGGKAVDLKTHRIIAIMNLTISLIREGKLKIIITVIVSSTVDYIPLVNSGLSCLKVPKNLRALTKVELNSCGRLCTHIKSCCNGTGGCSSNNVFVISNKVKSFKTTKVVVICSKCYVVWTKTDFLSYSVNDSGCLNGDFCSLSKRNRYYGLVKVKSIGSNYCNALLTNNLSIVNHLSGYNTLSAVRVEHTVFDSAHSGFLDSPFYVRRNLNLGTNCVGSKSAEAYGSTRSIVVVFGIDSCSSKLAVCGSSRYDENSVRGRSLTTVGKRTVNLKVLAGALRTECSRSTTITVSGNNTTHLDHVLSHLIRGETSRIGSLLAVRYSKHKATVGSYTDKGSGCNIRRTVSRVLTCILVNRISVSIGLNQEGKENRNGLLFPTSKRICGFTDPCLRHIIRTLFSSERMVIIVNNHNCLYSSTIHALNIPTVSVKLTIKDRITERLADKVRIILVVLFGVPAE